MIDWREVIRNAGRLIRARGQMHRLTACSKGAIYQSFRFSMSEGYWICPPELLDCTQPEDFGYGSDEWQEAHDATFWHYRLRKKEFDHRLSNFRNLQPKVLVHKGPILYAKTNLFGLMPEISSRGLRRCVVVRPNGMRCALYADSGILCHAHSRMESITAMFGDDIRNTTLREHYLKAMNDPDYKSTKGELALMRGMLTTLLTKLDPKNIDMDQVATLTTMCEKISGCAEKLSAIEHRSGSKLSPDQLHGLIEAVVGLVVKVMEPSDAQLERLAEGIATLQVFKKTDQSLLLDYGKQEANAKFSSLKDAYTPSGERIPGAFTEQEVIEAHEMAQEGFQDYKRERNSYRARRKESINEIKRDLGLDQVPEDTE